MESSVNIKRITTWLLITILFVQITACGTILYPERRGQSAEGGVDITVALLDGVGLFFGLVPGVIAFAVDLSTGAIYLPANRSHSLTSRTHATNSYRVVQVNQDQLTQAGIEQAIYQETGTRVNLSDDDVKFIQLENVDQVKTMVS